MPPWHTINNRLVIDETYHIGFLRETVEGEEHDKRLPELAGYTPHAGVTSIKMGDARAVCLATAHHRMIASSSIRIDHVIGGLQSDLRVKDKRRRLKDGMRHTMMETC
jgi:hypothetical protein